MCERRGALAYLAGLAGDAVLVVRECFYGTTRFEDFMERIGTSAPAVSRALKRLESAQIITRVPYQEPRKRVHDEYRLTEAGEDLLPVFLSLMQWGDKYLQNGNAPLSFGDADTGRTLGVRDTADINEFAARSGEIEIRFNTRSGAGHLFFIANDQFEQMTAEVAIHFDSCQLRGCLVCSNPDVPAGAVLNKKPA